MSQNLFAAKDIVTRKNQDGSIVVMKLDESNIFFKLTGHAAIAFDLIQYGLSTSEITAKFPEITADMISSAIADLSSRNLVVDASSAIANKTPLTGTITWPTQLAAGSVQDFNLEQIESEVLSDSLYLDVFAGSDLRLKQNLTPVANALEKVKTLEAIHFNWNKPEAPTGTQTGLIAQQVYSEMPELVKQDETTGYLAVNYTKLIPYLVESIKQLSSEVESLKAEVAQLKKH